jgi:hypothetical protein
VTNKLKTRRQSHRQRVLAEAAAEEVVAEAEAEVAEVEVGEVGEAEGAEGLMAGRLMVTASAVTLMISHAMRSGSLLLEPWGPTQVLPPG